MLRTSLVAAATLAAALTPATATASRSQVTYEATFQAGMSERWQFNERSSDDCELTGAMCTRTTVGTGSARVDVRSRRPTRVMVLRGSGGRPPAIGVGTGDGIPLVGSYLRTGSLETDYAGPWDAGNPDVHQADGGCGTRPVRTAVTFAWRGRGKLHPSAGLLPLREKCPDGPPTTVDWAKGEAPSFSDTLATAAPSKFLGAKQFTVRGQRTFTGTVEPESASSRFGSFSRSGSHTVTWTWEATFRRVKR